MIVARANPRRRSAVLVLAAMAGILSGAWWYSSAEVRGLRPIAGAAFEASGVAYVPGTSGVLFADDHESRAVFWMELGPDGTQKGRARPVPHGFELPDPEGMTSDGSHVFVVGSQSKSGGGGEAGLVRFRFDPHGGRVTGREQVEDLRAFLAGRVPELRGAGARSGEDVLNIEALAWDPRGRRLLLGLRAPLVEGAALIVPLTVRDPSQPLSTGNLQVDGGRAIRLPLGDAGLRGLEYDGRAGAFRLIAEPAANQERGEFRLLEWDGATEPPGIREVARFPGRLKPEGVTHARIGGRDVGVLVFDTSRFLIMD